ncbi:MAG: DUF86 domain-containing protein [Planctomycetota bacterium]
MWRDDAYLLDMLLAAREIREHATGVTRERFLGDSLLQNALMHLIQIIGEAARKISTEFREAHPEVPWAEVIGMRHRLVHEYFRIIPEKVWDVVEQEIAPLIAALEPLVPPEEEDAN